MVLNSGPPRSLQDYGFVASVVCKDPLGHWLGTRENAWGIQK